MGIWVWRRDPYCGCAYPHPASKAWRSRISYWNG